MSRVYIQGVLDNIKGDHTAYAPVVEAIINGMQAIGDSGSQDGEVNIRIRRKESILDSAKQTPGIQSIDIEDTGIGLDRTHFKAFDDLYTPNKKSVGGKGFGRLMYPLFFNNVSVESYYRDDDGSCKRRAFDFGREWDIVENLQVDDAPSAQTGTTVTLSDPNGSAGTFNPDTNTFAHRVLERILGYFVDADQSPPRICVFDKDMSEDPVVLGALIGHTPKHLIQARATGKFKLHEQEFKYTMFQNSLPRQQTSHIHLVAHGRVVDNASVAIHEYIPEFKKDFLERVTDASGKEVSRKYVVQFCVYGPYLDANINAERSGFHFILSPLDQKAIEERAAQEARALFSEEVETRFRAKEKSVEDYVDLNPWFRSYYSPEDLSDLPVDPKPEDIEALLSRLKAKKDRETERDALELAASDSRQSKYYKKSQDIALRVSSTNQSNLVKYMVFRRYVLKLLSQKLRLNRDGKYPLEKELHDLIFPRGTTLEDGMGHNLWVLDEHLNFASFASSDKAMKGTDLRPDILAFQTPVAYREINKAHSPINIFEFKRPGSHAFINDKKDPLRKVRDYARSIKRKEVTASDGGELDIEEHTPFHAYIVADVDSKVEEWLDSEGFTPLPAGYGWFYDHNNMNLHVEYITWKKLLESAYGRHRKFFELLGIQQIDAGNPQPE